MEAFKERCDTEMDLAHGLQTMMIRNIEGGAQAHPKVMYLVLASKLGWANEIPDRWAHSCISSPFQVVTLRALKYLTRSEARKFHPPLVSNSVQTHGRVLMAEHKSIITLIRAFKT